MAIEDWYDSQRQDLGREFREAVDHAIARIADNPLACPEAVWYRPFDSFVVVLACVHGKRDPRGIRARLRGGA